MKNAIKLSNFNSAIPITVKFLENKFKKQTKQ